MSSVANIAGWASRWCDFPRRQGSDSSLPLKDPPRLPDPAIYSQERALANGETPTWNNLDIRRFAVEPIDDPNSPPPPHHHGIVVVTPRNLGDAAAVNVAVLLAYSEFGIGQPRITLPTVMVSMPAGAAVEAKFYLPESAPLITHPLGFHVSLSHPHDKDSGNNKGASAVHAFFTKPLGRDRTFDLPLANNTGATLNLMLRTFASDGLTIACVNQVTLAPGAQQIIPVSLIASSQIPDGVTLEGTVVATAPGFLDGVTWRMTIND
jgi:hypothetical protein